MYPPLPSATLSYPTVSYSNPNLLLPQLHMVTWSFTISKAPLIFVVSDRFTSSNIIHKSPEWTLMAVVFLLV